MTSVTRNAETMTIMSVLVSITMYSVDDETSTSAAKTQHRSKQPNTRHDQRQNQSDSWLSELLSIPVEHVYSTM